MTCNASRKTLNYTVFYIDILLLISALRVQLNQRIGNTRLLCLLPG